MKEDGLENGLLVAYYATDACRSMDAFMEFIYKNIRSFGDTELIRPVLDDGRKAVLDREYRRMWAVELANLML